MKHCRAYLYFLLGCTVLQWLFSPTFCDSRAILPYSYCLHAGLYSTVSCLHSVDTGLYMYCPTGCTSLHYVSTVLYCPTFCVYRAILPYILCLQGCTALYSVSTGLYCPIFCVYRAVLPYILCLQDCTLHTIMMERRGDGGGGHEMYRVWLI